jgi:hypothetical protein
MRLCIHIRDCHMDWQDFAKAAVEGELRKAGGGSAMRLVAQLMSGRQLAAASAAASATGDVRLATLIAQVRPDN